LIFKNIERIPDNLPVRIPVAEECCATIA